MAGRLPESVRPGPGADAEADASADPNAKRDVLERFCARTHLKQLAMELSAMCPLSEDCNDSGEVNFVESGKESLEVVEKVKTAFESKALVLQSWRKRTGGRGRMGRER